MNARYVVHRDRMFDMFVQLCEDLERDIEALTENGASPEQLHAFQRLLTTYQKTTNVWKGHSAKLSWQTLDYIKMVMLSN